MIYNCQNFIKIKEADEIKTLAKRKAGSGKDSLFWLMYCMQTRQYTTIFNAKELRLP